MLPTWTKSLSASGCFFIFGFQQLAPGAWGGFPCDSTVQGLLCFPDLQIAIQIIWVIFCQYCFRYIFCPFLGKGEKEIYTHLNAEFQRIARRDKKTFLSDQCREIKENRMGKTRDLFKKIRDTKGIFHAKMRNKGQKWYGTNRSRRY